MNRPIKFRAWDGKNMFYYVWLAEGYEAWAEAVMQFTGLTDAKGREIYEGDILRSNLDDVMTDEVIFDQLAASFIFRNVSTGFSQLRIEDWQWEVIGNIYENPELIAA